MKKRSPFRFHLLLFGIPSLLGLAFFVWGLDWHWAPAWLVSANLSAFLLWGWDKWQAKRRGWRVPELALHTMSALGATPAALIGMKLFRHKTMKPFFTVLYLIMFLFQFAIAFTLSGRGEAS
ncbi:MAG: DUF1294 domain-containing protein [Planctomycetota bacterium]